VKMTKKRVLRILALCLSLVLLAGAVTASTQYTLDLDSDGKINVWDIQLAVTQNKGAAHSKAILDEILGGGDELHTNADGKYEIWTGLGLRNLMERSADGESFILMRDLDLTGMDWTPLTLKGTFDGNGHTISNVTITKSVKSTYAGSGDMGFFGMVDHYTVNGETVQSVVKDLNLENVQITATDDAWFIGLLSGSNRGKIENCTTTGVVTDARTTLPDQVYVGAVVGRNNSSTPPGTVTTGTTMLTAEDGAGNKITGLTSRMAMDFADLSYPEGTEEDKQFARHIGIAGSSATANVSTNAIWQDITGDSSRLSETEQARRQTVVDTMYKMGTVQWTPTETVTYTRQSNGVAQTTHTHSNAYIAGEVYTGMPYMGGHNSSYERFMSLMEGRENGIYIMNTELGSSTKNDGIVSGFGKYTGVNCSVAVGWAWASVTPTRVYNDEVTSIYGGAAIRSAYYFVPNENNTSKYGAIAVGDYVSPAFDATKYQYGAAASDTQVIITTNGVQKMADCYAKAHMGDAITYAQYSYDATTDYYSYKNSHIRMLAADPVIIRDYKGLVDLEASYVLTHEQGDGLLDNKDSNGKWLQTYTDSVGTYNVKHTSWRINHKYTLSVLLTEEGFQAAKDAANAAAANGTFTNDMQPVCGWGFIPVTMRGFTNTAPNKAPYYSEYSTHPISFPNTGWYYSNYWTVSGTMVIQDANGNEVYNETKFLVDRLNSTNFSTIKLEEDFPDADDNLVEGQTYKMTLCFQASNGKVTYLDEKAAEKTTPVEIEFVYTPSTGGGTGGEVGDSGSDAD